MGLSTREYDDETFSGTIHTLTCDITGKKLVNILVFKDNDELDEDLYAIVEATSPFAPGGNSGTHRIGGHLHFGPIGIEECGPNDEATIIEDVLAEENDKGELVSTIIVQKKDFR